MIWYSHDELFIKPKIVSTFDIPANKHSFVYIHALKYGDMFLPSFILSFQIAFTLTYML